MTRQYNHDHLIGTVYGSLEVIGIGPTNKHRKKLLLVKCLKHPEVDPYYVVKQSLVNGSSKGCVECKRDLHTTHGKCNTRVYHAYKRMICRIKDIFDKDYENYGGRGIDMDPKYDPDYNDQGLEFAFKNFYNDIGDYQHPLTLDRENNNRGYWKDNMRLITITEQSHNRRNNTFTQEIVNNIRKDYDTGNYRNRDLVKKYNTTSTNISRIVLRKTWK